MAFFAALSGVLALACIWILRAALMALGRAERVEDELEAVRDRLWESEDRAESIRLEGERALEQAQARAEAGSQAKSRFLATVTHEMRTPLTGVIGTAGLLLDARLAPDQRTYARAIKSSAEAMLGLVDEILDLSRVEADRQAPSEEPFSPAALIEEVAELLAPRARDKALDFAVKVGPGVPEEVGGDAARVRQVLLNLAGNAVKFTEQGGVGLKVEAAGGKLRFAVEDTGPGFDPADTERLFEEFERGEGAGQSSGAGLGLAISRRLAAAMGGSLSGFAAPGQGATFTFELPMSQTVEASGDRPLAGLRIAIVSSAPFTGPWLAESLEAMGAAARVVDPAELDAAASPQARLDGTFAALVDREAGPSPSALAAAARFAGAERALLLLSPADRGELDRLHAQGFDGYLVKPVRASSLASRLLDPLGVEDRPAEPAAPAVPFPAGDGLKVLVAEDDPVSALIALAHLARLGHASVHVADGEAACEAFEREAFDAALIDIRMPRLNGCAAARRMRAVELAAGRAPALIFALTANVGDDAAARAAGMDGLMQKPLDRRALEEALAPLAGSRRTAVA
ncbi:hybrid sensor histidine kinase/response regulator [Chenggangzhangella methanolivorans]|uniref:histidine kinase n=1 Tax=Chenggangzhangella methanolivorans TaxID=1437009 RepID=A0A9E6R5R0_9HYPH|nr:ATP-binding protein [Chenggangzhangella methanolivorans]QZN98687.1 response regulator [Chenggangzhangella methanolivorans]